MKLIKLVLTSFIIIAEYVSVGTLYTYPDSAQLGYEHYQDTFVNSEVVQRIPGSQRDRAVRYQIIHNFLSQYKRPFTVLDIDAGDGYYSFRAAFEHPESVFVMVQGNNKRNHLGGSQLLDLCKAHTSLHNIVLLNTDLTLQEARRLSECEHFDVVLVLNSMYRFGAAWKEFTDIILNMGSYVIVEMPLQDTRGANIINDARGCEIERYLASKHAQVIGQVPQHTFGAMTTLYLLCPNKKFLKRKLWLMPLLEHKTHMIEADFNQKKLYKRYKDTLKPYQVSDWISGINLVTFKMCHGTYPTADMLKKLLPTVRDTGHNDWLINNMVLQGDALQLIDFKDPEFHPRGPAQNASNQECFDNHCLLFDITDPSKVEHFFWVHLLKKAPKRHRLRNMLRRWFGRYSSN